MASEGTIKASFEAKLAGAGILKDAISAVYEIVKEDVSFKLTKDGLFLSAMDAANVSMVTFRLLVTAFEDYKLSEERTIGVDMERLMQVVKQADSGDAVTIRFGGDEASNLSFVFKSALSTRRFNIPLLDNPSEGRKPPTINFEATVVVKSTALSQAISDAEVFSDSVIFLADSGKFSIEASGETGKAITELEKGVDTALVELQVTAPAKARYAVDYLKKIVKGGKLSETAKIQFKSDFPIQVEYSVTDKLQLKYVLAPRIESE
ncbi:MAG: proliferating cell nuclear antigen (pcna) [archaeon]